MKYKGLLKIRGGAHGLGNLANAVALGGDGTICALETSAKKQRLTRKEKSERSR